VTDERLALIVRSAFRGMMEAVFDGDRPVVAAPPPYPERVSDPEPVRDPDELVFPSVTAAEETLFGEAMPKGNADLDATLSALAQARARQAREAAPEVQGGPGEREVAEWLRIPNA
jgi:hypothetical protein